MKIRFTTALISDPIRKKGDEVELPESEAKAHIKNGYAIEIKEPKTNRKKNLKNVQSR